MGTLLHARRAALAGESGAVASMHDPATDLDVNCRGNLTLLEAIRPSHGRVLNYDRYVHPQGYESVSFASVGFYR